MLSCFIQFGAPDRNPGQGIYDIDVMKSNTRDLEGLTVFGGKNSLGSSWKLAKSRI